MTILIFKRASKKNIWIFLLFFSSSTFSQLPPARTAFLDSATRAANQLYTQTIGSNAVLYNGVEFKEYIIRGYDIGFPFFLSDDWLVGDITYCNKFFSNVYMMYDLVRDKVIIEHTYSHFKLELISEKIQRFSIPVQPSPELPKGNGSDDVHTFVMLVVDSTNKKIIPPGFYDLLYDGDVKVYAKRKKNIQNIRDSKTEITEYDEKILFYIYKNGTYFPVKSKSSVLNVFSERKTMIRKYLSENKIKFGENREYALKQSAKFYDESGK